MIEIINEKNNFRWNDWIDLFLCREKWIGLNWDLHIFVKAARLAWVTLLHSVQFLEVWLRWSADIWVLADVLVLVCLCVSFSRNSLTRWVSWGPFPRGRNQVWKGYLAQQWVCLALDSLAFSLWLWEDAGVARPEENSALTADLEPGGVGRHLSHSRSESVCI